ncbi:MAG: hypothetical protein V7603_3668 [Micromonosporaceae bacterium]
MTPARRDFIEVAVSGRPQHRNFDEVAAFSGGGWGCE